MVLDPLGLVTACSAVHNDTQFFEVKRYTRLVITISVAMYILRQQELIHQCAHATVLRIHALNCMVLYGTQVNISRNMHTLDYVHAARSSVVKYHYDPFTINTPLG